jgi:hypothetical protein
MVAERDEGWSYILQRNSLSSIDKKGKRKKGGGVTNHMNEYILLLHDKMRFKVKLWRQSGGKDEANL